MTIAMATDRAAVLARVRLRIAASRHRLSMEHPYFAGLILMSEVLLSDATPTACTDGKRILLNPGFIDGLRGEEIDGLLVHEVLHCALLHVPRRGVRDAKRWNIAADIQVNGMLRRHSRLMLPPGAVFRQDLEHLHVEAIYEHLLEQEDRGMPIPSLCLSDLEGEPADARSSPACSATRPQDSRAQLERYWADAEALARDRACQHGAAHESLEHARRAAVREPRVDWRTELQRHVATSPDDFDGFDRRLLSRKLYIETLETVSVKVEVCIDTSGSIAPQTLGLFLGELQSILASHRHLKCRVRWCDSVCSAPVDLVPGLPLPTPFGGGGTDFRPFFDALDHESRTDGPSRPIAIYFTDGYGDFPSEPTAPRRVLWVVPENGLASARFPFGEVLRIPS